jgi:hypothetical protein
MSGYLVSLVERARGEGAALQPRVRARFEPHGFEEVSAESETRLPAPVSNAPPAPVVPHVRATPLSIDDDVETVREVHTTTTRTEAPPSEPPAPASVAQATPTPREVAPPPPPVTPSDEVTYGVRQPQLPLSRRPLSPPHSIDKREIEIERERERETVRERLLPHPPLRVATTRSIERQTHRDTTRVVRLPHEADAEPQPIHITIGRIDVRAIAPPAQARPSSAAAKRNASLTLDDYLRRRDGGKR